jgi:membrane protease YdiL (CAAX protease family)
MSRTKNNTMVSILAVVVIAIIMLGLVINITQFGLQDSPQETTSVATQETGRVLSQTGETFFLNITVLTESNRPIQNAWVGYFEGGYFRDSDWTNSTGQTSFIIPEGTFEVKCERYQYDVYSTTIDISDDENLTVILEFQEVTYFGLPSWFITFVIGILLLAYAYVSRKSLNIKGWVKPDNWLGRAKNGSWTFIDKSTKNGLYIFSVALLVILMIIVIPNFPTFQNMAIYYIALGALALGGLFIEGYSKKFWIASIGLGKSNELLGNIVIGSSFALLFISLTGFVSQLDFIQIPLNSIISIMMTVIVASFFEEAFHSGILAPTIAEKAGITSSILLTSAVFMLGHGLTYGWTFFPLLNAFLFRIIATYIVLYRKSWMNIFIAHVIINTLSVFTFLVYTW